MKKKRLHEFSYVILFSRICHVGRYNARDRTNVSAATLAILVMSITESVRDKSQPFHPVFSCEHNDFFDFTSRVQPARYVLFLWSSNYFCSRRRDYSLSLCRWITMQLSSCRLVKHYMLLIYIKQNYLWTFFYLPQTIRYEIAAL